VLGLLGYAVGALAMTLAQSLLPIVIFWAIIGGLGASLLLPAMQSLIHGNFTGPMQRKAYALVGRGRLRSPAGRSARCWAASSRRTCPWRVAFLGEAGDHRDRALRASRLVHDVPYTG
jgi:MFS family permease